MSQLGRLLRVELRDVWRTEAQDFTPWLASEENISLLSETLGLDLEVEAEEKEVGPFRADILCRDVGSDGNSWVLIENQLERTDHTHMGQLITYAAGLSAVDIVWIAAAFSEEHRAALDWLNRITDNSVRFFGLEVEAWQIGDSVPAPKFNIVAKPNQWSRETSKAAKAIGEQDLTPTKAAQLRFWQGCKEAFAGHPQLRAQAPRAQYWTNLAIGSSDAHIVMTVNSQASRLGVGIWLKSESVKEDFRTLLGEQEAIEEEMGVALEWRELPDKTVSRILLHKSDCPLEDEERWSEYFEWLRETAGKFNDAFRARIRALR